MPKQTIIVAEFNSKNGWLNVKTNEGKEISIKEDKCPKLVAAFTSAKAGSEVTGNLVEKDGKYYMWDMDEKSGGAGGKTFAPKDKSFEAAGLAAQSASRLLSLTKDPTKDQFDGWFEHIHAKIMSKITK